MSLSSPIDELTLAALKRGCRKTRERVYRQYAEPAWTLALRVGGCEARAWDAVQSAFVLAFERVGQLQQAPRFGSWLRRILINQVMDQFRCAPGVDGAEDAEVAAPSHEDMLDLERAFTALDMLDRKVLWLHDAEGMTHSEIADLSGQTPSWSKSRLARAREKLRKRLSVGDRSARQVNHE